MTKPASTIDVISCALSSSMLERVCELKLFFRQNSCSEPPVVQQILRQAEYALYTVNKSESPISLGQRYFGKRARYVPRLKPSLAASACDRDPIEAENGDLDERIAAMLKTASKHW